MLLVERDRLFAVAGFGDHCHVRLLIDDGGEAVAHDRMIVGEDDADLGARGVLTSGWRFGTRTLNARAGPGCALSGQSPPIACARSRML